MTQKHTETAFRHAVAWTVAVTVALGVIKMLWPGHAGTLSALLLITVLFVKAHRHRVTLEIYGWHIREWSADIRTFLILCCTTLPLYILVYHLVMACRGMYLSAGNLQNILVPCPKNVIAKFSPACYDVRHENETETGSGAPHIAPFAD